MSITVDHLALDFKKSSKVGVVYGYELHIVEDKEFASTSRKEKSGQVKQA